MSRKPSPDEQKAFRMWCESGRTMKPAAIAAELGLDSGLIRKWKSVNKWEQKPDPPPKRKGAPRGNRNAVGNKGGPGGPPGNEKNLKHGLFRKFLPQDEETLAIYDMTAELTELDILWEGIRVQFTKIIQALKIHHVTNKEELIKEVKKQKYEVHSTGRGDKKKLESVLVEEEFNFQFAWDVSATGIKALSAAWSTIVRMLKRYAEALREASPDQINQERLARVDQIRASIDLMRSKVPNTNPEDLNKQITALAHLINQPVAERVMDDD